MGNGGKNINQYNDKLLKAIISAQREENDNLRKSIRMNDEPYQNAELLKLMKTVNDVIQANGGDTIYILPQQQDVPIKIVTDNVSTKVNSDGTLIFEQKITPEKIIKIDGKLFIKLRGEWYELEEENK